MLDLGGRWGLGSGDRLEMRLLSNGGSGPLEGDCLGTGGGIEFFGCLNGVWKRIYNLDGDSLVLLFGQKRVLG